MSTVRIKSREHLLSARRFLWAMEQIFSETPNQATFSARAFLYGHIARNTKALREPCPEPASNEVTHHFEMMYTVYSARKEMDGFLSFSYFVGLVIEMIASLFRPRLPHWMDESFAEPQSDWLHELIIIRRIGSVTAG